MAKVRLTTPDQQPWVVSGERNLTEEERRDLREGELRSEYKIREQGDDAHPQLVELRYVPNSEISLHYHDEDEIIYVLEGAMVVNNRTVGPGACLYIAGNTVYGFRAGPEGLHILNFRPRNDTTFHLPKTKAAAAG